MKTKKTKVLDSIMQISSEEVRKFLDKLLEEYQKLPTHNSLSSVGEYNLSNGRRGKKTKHKCSSCKGIVEAVYSISGPNPPVFGPAGKYTWCLSGYRCMDCKLIYDFS